MTNAAWQQGSPVRRRNYLDAGDVPSPYLNTDDPGDSAPAAPGMIGATPDMSAPEIAAAPAPVKPPTPFDNALDAYKAALAGAPVKQSPKWWERVLAGAAGGAAGWTNAASRIRNPIDINAVQQNLLYPGYKDKLSEWQSRVTPAKAALDLAATQTEMQQKTASNAATVNHLNAQAQYYEGLGRTSVQVTPAMERDTDGELKAGSTVPAQIVVTALNNAAGRWDSKARPVKTPAELYTEAMSMPGMDPNNPEHVTQAREYAMNGGKLPPPKPPKAEAAPRNLNAADILLHPNDFSPEQVKEARRQFAEEHRPPQNPAPILPPVPPAPTAPARPARFATAVKNGIAVISDGTQWVRQDSPAGMALKAQAGIR